MAIRIEIFDYILLRAGAHFSGAVPSRTGQIDKQANRLALLTHSRLVLRGGCEEEKPADEPQGFDLDAWKRLYSNTANTETILPQFWSMFDKEVHFRFHSARQPVSILPIP